MDVNPKPPSGPLLPFKNGPLQRAAPKSNMVAIPRAAAFVAACAALCVHGASSALRPCDPMELVELDIVKPSISACEATTPSLTTRNSSRAERDPLCGEKTTCGKLLPYFAYMTKNPCVERDVYSVLGGALLQACADFPYNSTDPKLVLVGKPPAVGATTPSPTSTKAPTKPTEVKSSNAGSQSAAPAAATIESQSANSSTPSPVPTPKSSGSRPLQGHILAAVTVAASTWFVSESIRQG